MEKKRIDISVIIPLFNEAENLEPLYTHLTTALEALGKTYEIILADDGSTDESLSILRRLSEQDSRLRVIVLRKNFGQSAAFSAGFDFARGDVIITLDGDLQNDPADIPLLLEKIDQGYDIVSGWRIDRKDSFFFRQLPSRIANVLISMVTGVKLHDYGCSLKAYRHDVVKNIKLYGEMHRFIPALASWMGVQVVEVPVRHAPRKAGESKYGLNRITRVIMDLIAVKFLVGYGTRPIQIFGLLGAVSLILGTALGIYLSFLKFCFGHPLRDRPLLLLVVLLVILGIQLVTMGLLGELVTRTYYETQDKPTYMIKEVFYSNSAEKPRDEKTM